MTMHRIERDLLGEVRVPTGALYGGHTVRAVENFPLSGRRVHSALIHAYGAVKLACARTNHDLGWWASPRWEAIQNACQEMMDGALDGHIVVDALQGGAGTSLNMNVNEVLANRALQLLGQPLGSYGTISPLSDINLHQSTNDTFPTALKVAAILALRGLERELTGLLGAFQDQEKALAHVVKVGRTQLQDAVLTTLGREMSAYAEAFGRDRWRVFKCEERLRVVNLGGTAIGTGLAAPRQYIFRATDQLREITGIGLARAENLIEATQNADVFAEVSGILKACAVNLMKVSGDLRLLSSGPGAGFNEIRLPPRQPGSSLMPGKVNPVIPEAATQAAVMVMAYDQAIAQACALGCLELNPFLPLVADALLHSLDLLRQACFILHRYCISDLTAKVDVCHRQLAGSTAALTALVDVIGHERAELLAHDAAQTGRPVRDLALERGWLTAEQYDQAVSPEHVTRLGSPLRRPGP